MKFRNYFKKIKLSVNDEQVFQDFEVFYIYATIATILSTENILFFLSLSQVLKDTFCLLE